MKTPLKWLTFGNRKQERPKANKREVSILLDEEELKIEVLPESRPFSAVSRFLVARANN